MDFYMLTWISLALISLALALWILAIQGFDMFDAAVQRCGDAGGACEEYLMDDDADIFGIMPSALAVGLLTAVILLFVADFVPGLLEIGLSLLSGLASVYYVGLQKVARRFCSICNYFHLANLAMAGFAIMIWIQRDLVITVPDALLAAIVFVLVVGLLMVATKLSEVKDAAEHKSDVLHAILKHEDHRTLAALKIGAPADFDEDALIDLTDKAASDAPDVVLALSIGCHFCVDALKRVLTDIDSLSAVWRIKLIFADSKQAQPATVPIITVITRSCHSLPYDARLAYLKETVLPVLDGQNVPAERLNRIAGNPEHVLSVGVPVVPFSPALSVNGVFLDESVNFPEEILAIAMQDKGSASLIE